MEALLSHGSTEHGQLRLPRRSSALFLPFSAQGGQGSSLC